MNLTKTSRYLSLILRHKPEAIGITLDEHGWANVDELTQGMNIAKEILEEIVNSDSKQRYSFSSDHNLIRANQGHSIPVDVQPQEVLEAIPLYHGTSSRFIDSIEEKGLLPMGRNYVQLSPDIDTATIVAKRHGGKVIILEINTTELLKDGYKLFKSANGVYLIKEIPPRYFTLIQ